MIIQFLGVAKSLGRVHEPQNLQKPAGALLQLLLRVMFSSYQASVTLRTVDCLCDHPSAGRYDSDPFGKSV